MTPTELSPGGSPDGLPETPAEASVRGPGDPWRKWLAIGTGIGIEIGAEDLRVVVARVRPAGVRVLGAATVAHFRERPASEWGADYASFLAKLGASHLAATVLLPRAETIVRQISLPGVMDRDLDNAVSLQLDTLHPYPEDEAVAHWARIGKTAMVLVGIARRSVMERYAAILAEGGVKVAALTLSAAVLHSAAHLLYDPRKEGFLAAGERDGELEAYGESPSYPIFSAAFDPPGERALSQARAELRLPAESEAVALQDVLPPPAAVPADLDLRTVVLAYGAALASACPRRSLRINLLPEDQRAASSRAMFVPTLVLAGLVLLMAAAVLGYSTLENRRYLRRLEAEIARTEPLARKSTALDRAIQTAQRRSVVLDDVRRRSRQDLDALNELTHLVAPPAWVSSLDLTRDSVQFAGEADQAAGLLKLLDSSPNFEHSEFTISLTRVASGESFAIRSDRKGVSK